jgi:hypothetical protein
MSKQYKLPIVFDQSVYLELHPELKNLSRSIDKKVFSFDFQIANNSSKINLTKEIALLNRIHLTDLFINKQFDISNLIKNDHEILNILKNNDSSTFIKFFKQGFAYFQSKKFKKARTYLKNALIFRESDLLTKKLLKDIESL